MLLIGYCITLLIEYKGNRITLYYIVLYISLESVFLLSFSTH